MAGSKLKTAVELQVGSLSGMELAVRQVTGREELSDLFHFDIDFFPLDGEPLDLAVLRGSEALLTLRRPDGAERYLHGILWSVEMAELSAGRPRYHAQLVPKLQLLHLARQNRIFQAKSVPEIVEELLTARKVKHRLALSGNYPPREYCVQYRESELSFLRRLLETEGIFFFFEHEAGGHTLVLADARKGCPELAGDAAVPFRFEERAGEGTEDEHLYLIEQAQRIRPGKVALQGYDFERPEMEVSGLAQVPGDPSRLEHYESPEGFVEPKTGNRLSKARLEELRLEAETFSGEGTCLRFLPGSVFEVMAHPYAQFNQKLLLVGVHHEARQQEGSGDAAELAHDYRNYFAAIEAQHPYRPRRRTGRPTAYTETATVVGLSSEEIYLDVYGRVKVQFHWDRKGGKDERSSCWIRVAQPWAGAAWGATFIPRIGQEVLVRFLEGDPDQPLVVGAVYNGDNRPPIALPEEKSKSTLRSRSSLGGDGSNELRFEDAKDLEEIYLHAQRDETLEVENDKHQLVYANETLEVEKDRSRTVSGNQNLSVGVEEVAQIDGDQSLTVGGSRETHMARDQHEEVTGRQSVTVAGSSSVEVGSTAAVTVGGAAALTVGGAYAVTVGGAHNVAVGGAHLEQTGGLKAVGIGAISELQVVKDASVRSGSEEKVVVDGQVTVLVKKDQVDDVAGGVALRVNEAAALLAKSFQLEAQQKLTITVGGKLLLQVKSSGDIDVKGASFSVNTSGNIAFKGSRVSKVIGAAASGAEKKSKDDAKGKKPAITQAKWSKSKVLPLHVNAAGAVPPDCDVIPEVQLSDVPDGTKATILICHAASGAMVKGGKIPCKVQGGKLVHAKTKKPPVFRFGPEQTPWDPYDKPFFFFKVSVEYQGLKKETPADVKDGGQSLKVRYLHRCIGDHWADQFPPHLTTGPEMAAIEVILSSIPDSKAEARMMKEEHPKETDWARCLAGTYCAHYDGHGTLVDCNDHKNPEKFINTNPPPAGLGYFPECPIGNWRGAVALSYPDPQGGGYATYLAISERDVLDRKVFLSVPRYLMYLDCCLAGWESSLGRAFVSRGTQYVLAFRKVIGAAVAHTMARKFYVKWVKTHKLDPDKIRDLFFEVGTPFYEEMRPVLIGWRYEPILDPSSGPLRRAWANIESTIGGIVSSIGSLFK